MLSFMNSRKEKIWEAARDGNANTIARLISAATADDLQYEGKDGDTALEIACKNGHVNVVDALLQLDIYKYRYKDYKKLLKALSLTKTPCISELLRERIYIKEAILGAVRVGNKKTISRLLPQATAEDLQYEGKDLWRMPALIFAAYIGHLDIVQMLLQSNKVDVNQKSSKDETTALMSASDNGHLPVVQYLVQQGADIHMQNKYEQTALMYASKSGHLPVLEYLVHQGADIHIHDKDGWTALINASFKGHLPVVEYLVKQGAAINTQNEDGDTALLLACTEDKVDVVKVLLQAGADKNILNNTGETALSVANTEEIKKLLVEYDQKNRKTMQSPHVNSAVEKDLSNTASAATEVPAAMSAESSTDCTIALCQLSPIPAAGSDAAVAANSPLSPIPAASSDAAVAANSPLSPISAAGSDAAVAAHSPLSPVPAASSDAAVAAHSPLPPILATSSDAVVATHSPLPPVPAASSDATAATAFTADDRAALDSFLQSFPSSASLQQIMCKVAAHDRTLNLLVSKQKECPSLFWFYPKQPKLRNWLSNPAKCLFQDTLMMVVVCPLTLCTVQCGPDGVGWEVNLPRKWVKQWGPAILFSVYVLQAAALAGRVVGIPLPPVPGAKEVKEVLGLNGMLNSDTQSTLSDSLRAISEVTKATLDETIELHELFAGLQKGTDQADKALPADLPMHLVDEAYKSIHTFLTTGENAKLGKLEDQLRGRMERVMVPDGDIEWVSVEGRQAWLDKHLALRTTTVPTPSTPVLNVAVHTVVAAASSSTPASGWLALRLMERGILQETAQHCHQQLVVVEGFHTEAIFAQDEDITRDYLYRIDITARGVMNQLLALHRELRAQYGYTPTTTPSPIPAATEAATLTADEKASMMQMQKTVDTLTSELNKLRASSAQAQQQQSSTGGPLRGGKGGLALEQAQCNVTNPRTRQPYTMDELAEEIHRHEKALAQCSSSIVDVASATEERFAALPTPPLTTTADKTAKKG